MTLTNQEILQVNQALFSVTHAYEARMQVENPPEKTGMTMFDCAVLMVIGQFNPIRSTDLAQRMNVQPSTISIYVKRLTKKGLIRMERNENDRRAWWIQMTKPGQMAYRMIIKGTIQYTQDILLPLDQEEARMFHTLLIKLSHALGFDWQ